jgi:hypothetical protein
MLLTTMNIDQVLQVLAACQGAFILGISIFIIHHYLRVGRSHADRTLKFHIIGIAISYNLLTICGMCTIYMQVWPWQSLWQIGVIIAWALGDVSVLVMLRRVTRKYANDQFEKRLNEIRNDKGTMG